MDLVISNQTTFGLVRSGKNTLNSTWNQRVFTIWFNLINKPVSLFYKRALCP